MDKATQNLKARLIEKNIRNFSDSEVDRVLESTVSPAIAKRRLTQLIGNGLTVEKLYKGED